MNTTHLLEDSQSSLLRILLVEDNQHDMLALRRALKKAQVPYQMTTYVKAEKAWQHLQTKASQFDLLVTDYKLPGMTGLELCRQVLGSNISLPLVILTGAGTEYLAVEALKAGVDDYLIKDSGQGYLELLPVVLPEVVRKYEDHLARQQAEEALRESQERYELAARGANDGLWDWNLKTNHIFFSPRWKGMLGYEEDEIAASPREWFEKVHPEDREELKRNLDDHLAGFTPHFENEHRMLHRDGHYRWMLSRGLAVRDKLGEPYRMAGSLTDITSLKTANARLHYEARHDSLTGLLNRAAFMSSLEEAIEKRKEDKDYQFALLFLDLDRFKSINDTLGHLVGDQLLIAVARRLQNCVRTGDIVARQGGDEFTLLLNHIEGAIEARRIAERIQNKLALPVNVDSQQVFTCASIGIALGNQDYERLEDMMRDADTAMYRAKALSRAEHQLLGMKRQGRIVTNLGLEKELWRALENQEFEIYYQPIVSLNSTDLVGIEALLRWQHPKRGLLSPKDFIPLLEETGLIVPLGEWVLRTACLQIQAWHDIGLRPPAVAVNMSARQFQQKNLVPLIEQVLNETGLTTQALELEITEGVAMQNTDFNQNTLNGLKSMGLQLTIDDFGTGYSSLNRLTRLPIKSLKIDRSFVKEMSKSENDKDIISAMIAMAHSLNLKVIAEGVETIEQLAFLRSQRCDEMQGYLFSQPVPAEDVTEMLMHQGE